MPPRSSASSTPWWSTNCTRWPAPSAATCWRWASPCLQEPGAPAAAASVFRPRCKASGLDLVAWLSPTGRADGAPVALITGDQAAIEPEIEDPDHPGARLPWSGHMGGPRAGRGLPARSARPGTALVFVNTRAQAEIVFRELWHLNEDKLADRAAPRQPLRRAAPQGRGRHGARGACAPWSPPRRSTWESTGRRSTW